MLFLLLFYLTLELILVQSGRKCSQSNCTSSRLLSVTFFPLLPLQPSLPHSPSHTFTVNRGVKPTRVAVMDSDTMAKSWYHISGKKKPDWQQKTEKGAKQAEKRWIYLWDKHETWDINPLATVVGLWRHCYSNSTFPFNTYFKEFLAVWKDDNATRMAASVHN